MRKPWIPKLEAEEKKYLECIIINNMDRVIRSPERKEFVGYLNNLTFQKWSEAKLKASLIAVRKELGVIGKKGGALRIGKKKEKVLPVSKTNSVDEEIAAILTSALCKIQKVAKRRLKEQAEELTRVKAELADKTQKLRDLRDIRQAVEKYKG